MPVRRRERRAGVETQARPARDQRVGAEALVLRGVRHEADAVLQDGVCAEGDPAGRLRELQAAARLEPLAVLVDERDQGDRHTEDVGRQPGDAVEGGLGGRVEDVEVAQRG